MKPGRRRMLGRLAVPVIVLALSIVLVRRERSSPAPASSSPAMAGMEGLRPDGQVRLSASQVREFGVTYGTVDQRMLTSDTRTVGTVIIDESRTSAVTSKIGGFVERLFVNTTGQPVRRGQALAELFSPELLAAEEELLLARGLDTTIGESAVPGVPASQGNLLAAARRRLRLWDVSDAQIDEVLRTGKPRRTVTFYSPVTGIVTEKKVTVGEAVQAGTMLYAVADLRVVWVEVQLREADAGQVSVGSAVDLELAAFPGRPYKGRVAFVYPTVTEQTRAIRARVSVANADGRLKPGMYATVRVRSATRLALTAPRTSIIQTGERAVAFVDMGNGALKPVDVELGTTVGAYVEILSGLEPGQRVVTSAQFLLDSESNLAEVMRGMAGMTGGMTDMDMKGMDMKSATSPAKPR